MGDGTVFGARAKPFAPPSGWVRLVKDGAVLAAAKSVEVAETIRDRWALFGLAVEVRIPKRRSPRAAP